MRLSGINVSPVKGFRLLHPESVELGPRGVAGNRRFFLVGPDGRRKRTSTTAWPCLVEARWDAGAETLRLRFADGTEVEGDVRGGGERVADDVSGTVVAGPWDEPLAALAGEPVRLVRSDTTGVGLVEPVTLVSDGSLRRFAREAGVEAVDARRFRMLLELEGVGEHEEDGWEGRRLRVVEAILRVGGPVDRCAATTRDPETARRDLDALRILKDYRGQRPSDGAVLFGVYAQVVEPGTVRVGDAIELL